MIESKKIRIFIALTILLASGAYFFPAKKYESSNEVLISLKDYVLSGFLAELKEINSKLPYKIDGQTTLLSIRYEDDKVVSLYELALVGISREFIDKIKPSVTRQACNEDLKKKLLDVDVEFLEKYKNSVGEILFEIPVSKSICSEL
jgi:hypothetical protein